MAGTVKETKGLRRGFIAKHASHWIVDEFENDLDVLLREYYKQRAQENYEETRAWWNDVVVPTMENTPSCRPMPHDIEELLIRASGVRS